MANIRPIDQIAKKWATVTPTRSGDYETGVNQPRKDWMVSTRAAENAYKDGVNKAVAQNRFSTGVVRAGTDKWKKGALEKGVTRWGPGVAIAEGDYRQGFAPYRDAIERVTLPTRYAKRDPRNLERVKAVVNALIAVKESKSGGPGR